jgi:hypothetical protein
MRYQSVYITIIFIFLKLVLWLCKQIGIPWCAHTLNVRSLKANSHIPCRSHASPMLFPCHATTMSFWKWLLKATAQRGMGVVLTWHGICELASAIHRWHVGDLPALGFFRLPRRVPGRYHQKHTNPLNSMTSSSGISGYHVDFHEGHDTVGEWQGRGMGTAWHVWISLKLFELAWWWFNRNRNMLPFVRVLTECTRITHCLIKHNWMAPI